MIYDNVADGRKGNKPKMLDVVAPASVYHCAKLTNGNSDAFRKDWQNANRKVGNLEKELKVEALYELFKQPTIELGLLPLCSFVIQFTFTLAQPYISRDDQDFYIIDNPVRKDKLLGLPYVAPTSWKGSLRAAFRRVFEIKTNYEARENLSKEDLKKIGWDERLFGNQKGVKESAELLSGRLNFYPTFFTQKSLEIINPHDRARRVGKNPILIESVPINATGVFTLLYVPFNYFVAKSQIQADALADLKLVAEALQAMFCKYGFGAKTSSGFGLVSKEINGFLELNRQDRPDDAIVTKLIPPIEPQPPTVPEAFNQKYLNEDFKTNLKEWGKSKSKNNRDFEIYKQIRAQKEQYQKDLVTYQAKLQEYEAQKAVLPPAITKRYFSSFDELKEKASQLMPEQPQGEDN